MMDFNDAGLTPRHSKMKSILSLLLCFVMTDVAIQKRADAEAIFKVAGRVETVAFSPDGKLLAAGTEERYATNLAHYDGRSGHIYIWNARTHKLLRSWPLHGGIAALMFSHDGQRLISGSGAEEEYGEVCIWQVKTGRLLGEHHEPTSITLS